MLTYGSVRGVPGDWHPYRDPFFGTLRGAKNPHIITFPVENCKDRGQVGETKRLTSIP